MHLRPARPDEAALLSDLAVRSKGHWGYDAEFLAGSRRVLSLQPEEVLPHRTTVAEVEGRVVGFYTLVGGPPVAVLEHLFVEPADIGTGIGRRLWTHAVDTAARLAIERFTIDSDPFAEAFYLAMGAKRTGESPSEVITGRVLPQLTWVTLDG
jgi:GNAT superfamily N-acetyltransferase